MKTSERVIQAGDLPLAIKTWGDPKNQPVLALHGWQDNAATFDRLIPLFPDYYWIVPDLPGHGQSQHRGHAADYSIWHYCVEVMALADALGLEKFILVGHSMGGSIASLLAGSCPERIEKLVLLDVIGTITTPAANSPAQLRESIEKRTRRPLRKAGLYPDRTAAEAARAKVGVTPEAAALLGERGIEAGEEGYYWRHDQRLTLRSLMSLGEEQMAAFLAAITCEVLLVVSKEAVQREEVIRERAALVKRIRTVHFDGGHHQHLDGDVAAIAACMRDFLEGSGT